MSRLAAVRPADSTSAQKKVIDAIAGGARGRDRALDSLLDERGVLAGPFNAWVRRPDLGIVVQRLGERLRFHGSLPGSAREIAILAVGAKWMAEYEWWAHSKIARREGVSDETIDAIRRGERPQLPDPVDQAAHDFTAALLEDRPARRPAGWTLRRTMQPARISATAGSWSSSPWLATTPSCRSPSMRSRCRCLWGNRTLSRIGNKLPGTGIEP